MLVILLAVMLMLPENVLAMQSQSGFPEPSSHQPHVGFVLSGGKEAFL